MIMKEQWLLAALFLLCMSHLAGGVLAAEGGMRNVYENLRIGLFRNEEFVADLRAKTADAAGLGQNHPKVELTGVQVEIFYTGVEKADMASDDKPPLKVRITSDQGTYLKVQSEDGTAMQDVIILKGNVKVERYALPSVEGGRPVLEATLLCDSARWNNDRGVLNASGAVDMKREDGSLSLVGQGMIYQINPTKRGKVDPLDGGSEDMGGGLEMQSDVRMQVRQKDRMGRVREDTLTTITSKGPALYDFDKKDMSFEKDVNVLRSNMRIACNKLYVVLFNKPGQGTINRMTAESTADGLVQIRGKGNPQKPADASMGEWKASARYAVYRDETGELILTDDRPGVLPLAQFENHQIRNTTIRFYVREKRLLADGKFGSAVLGTGLDEYSRENPDAARKKTIIRFDDKLFFDNAKHVAQFNGNVKLTSEGLEMDSQTLRVDFENLEGANRDDATSRVSKVTASDKVKLLYQGRKAKCEQLEIIPNPQKNPSPDDKGRVLLDQFIMSGQPVPEIEIPGGGYFQAQSITTTRFQMVSTAKRIVLIHAKGPGSGLFGKEKSSVLEPVPGTSDATTIRFSNRMVYDELEDKIFFNGEVTATNDDQVLRSDQLDVWLFPVVDKDGKEQKELRRLVARGSASMHWGLHHCEADIVDRQMPDATGKSQNVVVLWGKVDRPARIWEENGASFQGPWITASADGSAIYSKGGGELTMLDRDTNEKAMVIYSGDAYYKVTGKDSMAIFRKDVVLRRGDMKVTGDKMQADLVQVKGAQPGLGGMPDMGGGSGVSSATLPRRLKRVTIEGNVIIRQGKRMAFGNKGQVDIGEEGDVMLLEGTNKQRAEVNDNNGFSLFAPRLMVKESAGIITAAGPGEVRIESPDAARSAGMDTSMLGQGGGGYRLYYQGKLLYNMLLRKIRFENNVRLVQSALRGNCDMLTIYLSKNPNESAADKPIEVENIEAMGHVRFTRLPMDPAGRDQYELPGRTILTKSEEAYYDALHHVILLTGKNSRASVIAQEIGADGRRNRYIQRADRIWVKTDSGVIEASQPQEILPLPSNGALRFPDD